MISIIGEYISLRFLAPAKTVDSQEIALEKPRGLWQLNVSHLSCV